jgi:signal transduction histidine kinase/ligand-binding sensor domain-containing protein/AraC-like DNA-binding protein
MNIFKNVFLIWIKQPTVISIWIFGLSFAIIPNPSFSIDFSYKFEHLGIRQGLSQSTVLSLLQDQYGFIWVGTRDGLNKYNGYEFEVFRYDVGNPTTISGNIINDIQEDKNGDIWVVHENGLSKLNRAKGIFLNYSLNEPKEINSDFNVLKIDSNNNIWVGGRKGLYTFDPNSEKFSQNIFSDQADGSNYNMVSSFSLDKDGQLWFGTSKFGLFKIDNQSKKIIPITKSSLEGTTNSRIESLVHLPNGNIWVGTFGSGLYLLDYNGSILQHYSQKHKDKSRKISHDNIRRLLLDKDGLLWVGTFDGLNIVNEKSTITQIKYEEDDIKGLSHGSIRALLMDKKGSIWVGTYYGGINIYDENTQRFRHNYNLSNQSTSLSYNVVGAFGELEDGKLLIGTERGGLNIFDPESGTHRVIGDREATIKSIISLEDDKIWMGVFRKGLHKYDHLTAKIKSFPTSNNPGFERLNTAIINAIRQTNEGKNLWIATDSDGGLYKFDLNEEKYVSFEGDEILHSFLGNYSVKNIYDDAYTGKLYLSTKGKGIVIFDPKTGNIKQLLEFEISGEKTIIDEFNHVFRDESGKIWLSSNGAGVISLDEKTDTYQRYHSQDGLGNNIVWGTLQDPRGTLWFITLNALSKMQPNANFQNYFYYSGFPLEEFNEGAFYKTQDGVFLLGGNNGYVLLDPERLVENTFLPPLVFTGISISNQKVYPGDESGLLQDELTRTKRIILEHFQSVITIDFAALNYIRPENNQYQFKLENFDENWISSGNKRSVTYTNLPDGEYVLLVKGSNNDGLWTQDPIRLEFKVLPPPWRTWWAMTIYALGTIVGFFIIRYNAVKSTQLKNNLKIEQLEKEKWKDFHDLKLRYFIDVSHEFRTPLTLIISPLEELMSKQNQDNWVRSRLKLMFFNAKRLLLLIDQILEIREIETGHHQINSSAIYLKNLVEEIVESFKGLADKKNIKLELFTKNLRDVPLLIDRDKIEKILFNLISNAFKFTPSGGEIIIKVTKMGDFHQFEVQDSGIGMDEEIQRKIFDRFFKSGKNNYGAGIGLSLTQSLVEILGGEIEVFSKPHHGSLFKFTLPLKETSQVLIEKQTGSYIKPLPLEYQESVAEVSTYKDQSEEDLTETILVVEDNIDLKKYLKDHLRSEYNVITAKDGKSGLNKALKNSISLIISDVMMPEMDGFELCKQVKTIPELCHIPIILLTAKSSQNNRLEGLEYGADDYMAKPFNLLELKIRIKNIIQNRNRLHQKYRQTTFLPDSKLIAFNSFDEKLLTKVNLFLKNNLDRPNLTVEFISEEVGLSRVHLFRKIKALTGFSPTDYIKDFRIKNACQMLLTGNYKIADVAYSVGFQDVHYFSKVFKKEVGKSPTDFLKDSLKEEEKNL